MNQWNNAIASALFLQNTPMPNVATALKTEIARLTRKELRQELAVLKKASVQYRASIAAMKRDVAQLEQQVRPLQKGVAKHSAEPEPVGSGKQIRFSPERMAAHREKLGLSAKEYGALLGVSTLTVYKWEKGQTRPRARQLEAIAKVRSLGKREAARQLQESLT